ncbi:MAG: SRPBCC domain-containing protein [Bacteroidetes bacterium]|nr:SRPBCC domain-containing protein [Bacteroidota bacterium]
MKTLRKTYAINASAHIVRQMLLNKEQIENWSGASAEMNLQENASFSLWDGDIHGINLFIGENELVQHWKEAKWEHFSTVVFYWIESDGITELTLIHTEIPNKAFDGINQGWDQFYCMPLKELAENY